MDKNVAGLVWWLGDAAQVLQANGTTDHAEKAREAASTIRALIAEIERLRAEIEQLTSTNARQANCINNTARALGPDYTATVEGLPKAAAHVAAKLREAVEEMRTVDAMIYNDNGDVTWSPLQVRSAVRAFLATMEKQDG